MAEKAFERHNFAPDHATLENSLEKVLSKIEKATAEKTTAEAKTNAEAEVTVATNKLELLEKLQLNVTAVNCF